jgi:hypothetical protein
MNNIGNGLVCDKIGVSDTVDALADMAVLEGVVEIGVSSGHTVVF